jgi:hypothetical protein
MLLVPPPAVIVPLLMDQAYLAPLPPLATDAVLPAEPAHTEAGAVMVATGSATTAIDLLPEEALHPTALITVTESVTEPDAGAVNVMILLPPPDVMVAFVTVQL